MHMIHLGKSFHDLYLCGIESVAFFRTNEDIILWVDTYPELISRMLGDLGTQVTICTAKMEVLAQDTPLQRWHSSKLATKGYVTQNKANA